MAEGSPPAMFEETYQLCWRPFLSTLYRFSDIPAALHYSGTALEWLASHHPEFIMLLEEMSTRKQVELVGGAFFSPILPIIPASDRVGQIESLTTFIRKHFGKRPRGAWTPEFAWEPSLVSTYLSCGLDHTFLPAALFRAAGFDPLGPVMTEDQGKYLLVFPVHDPGSQEEPGCLFSPLLRRLGTSTAEGSLTTVFLSDHRMMEHWEASGLESPDIMFEADFAALQREMPELEITTPGRWSKLNRSPQRGYLPCSGSALLAERSAPETKPEPRECGLMFTPRRLLVRYPESQALYAKMNYIRLLVSQLRGDKSRKKSAQDELWRGQGGDAYWHGPNGGLLCLPIRAAAYAAFIQAEKTTRLKAGFTPGIIRTDTEFGGFKEMLYRGADYNAALRTDHGALVELSSLRSKTNYVNAMGSSSAGQGRLMCFVDWISGRDAADDDLGHPSSVRYSVSDREYSSMTAQFSGDVSGLVHGVRHSVQVDKTFAFRKDSIIASWLVSNTGAEALTFRFGTQFNLAIGVQPESMTASVGTKTLDFNRRPLVDETLSSLHVENMAPPERLEFRSDSPFHLSGSLLYLPVMIRSKEQRLFQGTRFDFGWDLELAAGAGRVISLTLELSRP
jgi:hypothetical protein